MNICVATQEDLKKLRPDLYKTIKQEVCLGELRLDKDDIHSLIEPLSETIKEFLQPYLSNLPVMTHNDVVDMENDIIDEISEQLQNELVGLEKIVEVRHKRKNKCISEPEPIIKGALQLDLFLATIEDLKRFRPDLCDLLYVEFQKACPLENPNTKSKPKEKKVDGTNNVKREDVLRWNYSKEEGVVVGFDSSSGERNFIVQQCDGKKIIFENDPNLFTILDGEEKQSVISKWKKYIKDRKEARSAFLPQSKKKPTE
jgi:hypothetical protein